jgi:hypothetical protein
MRLRGRRKRTEQSVISFAARAVGRRELSERALHSSERAAIVGDPLSIVQVRSRACVEVRIVRSASHHGARTRESSLR